MENETRIKPEIPCSRGKRPQNIAITRCCLQVFRLWNDLYCVGWGVKLYSLTLSPGSKYGMCDLHVYPMFERFPALQLLGIDIFAAEKFPRLAAWVTAMQCQECVRKVWMSPKTHCQYLEGYFTGIKNYDAPMDDETLAMQKSVAWNFFLQKNVAWNCFFIGNSQAI